jgi:hypothetical protein
MSNSRTRVISQSKAVYLTPTGWTNGGADTKFTVEADQLQGVDTFSYEIDLAGSRQDVREFGQLARIGTVRMSEINPTLSFGYYLNSGANEKHLGFNESEDATSQCISAFLSEDVNKKESNIFVGVVDEGDDAVGFGDQSPSDVIGFGNCFLSSYSVNLSVGEIPRADIEMQASNVVFYSDSRQGLIAPSLNLDGTRAEPDSNGQAKPNIDLPTAVVCGDLDGGLKVLKPHDITLTFANNEGVTNDGINAGGIGGQKFSTSLSAVQSVSIDVPLAREVIESIGTQLAYAKPLQFPIDVTMNMSALVTEFGEGALEYALTGTAGDRTTDISVAMNAGGVEQMEFTLKGAVLDSQSFSQGLDDNETVDLTFSAQIGGASTSDQGLFMTKLLADDSVSRTTAAKDALTTADADQPIEHGA